MGKIEGYLEERDFNSLSLRTKVSLYTPGDLGVKDSQDSMLREALVK